MHNMFWVSRVNAPLVAQGSVPCHWQPPNSLRWWYEVQGMVGTDHWLTSKATKEQIDPNGEGRVERTLWKRGYVGKKGSNATTVPTFVSEWR